jgi:hypothetical protein
MPGEDNNGEQLNEAPIEEGVSSLSDDEIAAIRQADEEHRAKAEAGEPVQEVEEAPPASE